MRAIASNAVQSTLNNYKPVGEGLRASINDYQEKDYSILTSTAQDVVRETIVALSPQQSWKGAETVAANPPGIPDVLFF